MTYLYLNTPLDKTVSRAARVQLLSISGQEGICQDFDYNLIIITDKRLSGEEFERLIGDHVTVGIQYLRKDETVGTRYINGMVYQLLELGVIQNRTHQTVWKYQLNIGSDLRRLASARDCRIYQKNDYTAIKIIIEALRDSGVFNVRNESDLDPVKRSYTTCYNETRYDFITRLANEAGIYWYFEHQKDKHILVFSSGSTLGTPTRKTSQPAYDRVESLRKTNRYQPVSELSLTSYQWETPPAVSVKKTITHHGGGLKHFEFPGRFSHRNSGTRILDKRKRTLVNAALVYTGESERRDFMAGGTVELDDVVVNISDDKSYVIQQLEIKANSEAYHNTFKVVPAITGYTPDPDLSPPKPRIESVQTAVVVGHATSDMDTNEKSVIRIRFHWDHPDGPNSEKNSAFVRTMFPAAGNQRGFLFTPHVGDEVVVSFEDGDPDRPVVIGCVYNTKSKVPFSPGANQNKSGIFPRMKANALSFDDTSREESFDIKATKDMEINVGGNLDLTVTGDITMVARSIDITSTGNVFTGNIVTSAGQTISNVSLKVISNTTLLLSNQLAGVARLNIAGGAIANAALGMASTTSGGKMAYKGANIFNTTIGDLEINGQESVKTKSPVIMNTAKDIIENSSGGSLKNKAGLAIITKSEKEINSVRKEQTEALLVKKTGDMVVNSD